MSQPLHDDEKLPSSFAEYRHVPHAPDFFVSAYGEKLVCQESRTIPASVRHVALTIVSLIILAAILLLFLPFFAVGLVMLIVLLAIVLLPLTDDD